VEVARDRRDQDEPQRVTGLRTLIDIADGRLSPAEIAGLIRAGEDRPNCRMLSKPAARTAEQRVAASQGEQPDDLVANGVLAIEIRCTLL